MELFYSADSKRLAIEDIQEMNTQFNCNLENSEDDEKWFDGGDELPNHITIIDEAELFAREEEL